MLINDLNAHIRANEQVISDAVTEVIASGWLVLGPKVKQFEQSFAEYVGVSHCVTVANGTDAIELALRALGVQQGDAVATVANAGMYASTAILAIGAVPVFMDVEAVSKNVTLPQVMQAIDSGVKAVVITHLYGLAVPEIGEISNACAMAGVALLEDCAQAHGASVDGIRVGAFGDAASFSFYPTKNLGALGDGGAVTTNRLDVAEKLSRLRQYGWTDKYRVELSGARNSRLDEMQAAILSVLLPRLDGWNVRRRYVVNRYVDGINNPNLKQPKFTGAEYVAHLYVVTTNRRDSLRSHLRQLGIATDVHYPIPDHRQPVFSGRYSVVRLPITEQLAEQVVTLPCYPEMTDEQICQVIDGVNSWQP